MGTSCSAMVLKLEQEIACIILIDTWCVLLILKETFICSTFCVPSFLLIYPFLVFYIYTLLLSNSTEGK